MAQHPQTGPRTVEILNAEEKGSDVNLASYLLMDGFENDYEMAVVISNDSDLKLPIRMTRTKLGKQIGVFDPSNVDGASSYVMRPLGTGGCAKVP